ncbi:hypothetical protein COU17_00350 [Candidatus Kaiserbacteria bacterium CG10_big_fil_rev_8_21_14_0_10_49_17]|uniref:DUF8128 domain-containing protein n=1 Tax=Candidatus Kaiserbacteria bacterium CG10_big_fil_rev_8_21_14_0_10_49_17 TaxID=1974609 RepID=A0A2M6WF71_9BACT|nr:MAG: hypothetical protein COU17_00350 [Candidatus Kaiserbacteria bacterium CG10_big_fil_rev_8_21_14_0_10_49_17]
MQWLVNLADKFGFSPTTVLVPVLVIILSVITYLSPSLLGSVFRGILALSPLWLPVVLLFVFWGMWKTYIRTKFINSQEYVLLEIRLPQEISKSPKAMETVLTNFHLGMGEATFINRWLEGRVRPWFSLEIASIEGEIHFFIWTRRFLQDIVEAQIYGQYPNVQITEVEDYTKFVEFNVETMNVWGCDFKLTKEDALPIRTYVDYGLDKDPKEEYKIDPMAGFFEFLGRMGPGEQLWFQILIRQNKDKLSEDKRFKKDAGWGPFGGYVSWKDEAKAMIQKIREESSPQYPGQEFPGFPNPTFGQKLQLEAIERSISKPGFDAGIRGIYIAKKENFNASNIPALTISLKQLNDDLLNGFAPTGWFTAFSYPWQDYKDRKKNKMKAAIIDAYKRRSWFYPPYETPHFVLNTEELATLYHFPGEAVSAPALRRIPSTTGGAPTNLPT